MLLLTRNVCKKKIKKIKKIFIFKKHPICISFATEAALQYKLR